MMVGPGYSRTDVEVRVGRTGKSDRRGARVEMGPGSYRPQNPERLELAQRVS